jgi:hypothetical protein
MPRPVVSFGTLLATLALLAAAVAVAPVEAVDNGVSFITLNPATFTVNDHEPAKVKIKLNDNPGNTPVAVFLEADGVLFDKCRLDFNGQNFGTEQEVTIFPKAAFEQNTENTSIFGARLAWANNANHNKVQSMTFKRIVRNGRVCQANGDPHYVSFDKKAFDYYKNCFKAYWMMKSDTLAVLSQHGPWIGNANNAVNTAIAVAYGDTVYIIDANKKGDARISRISASDKGIQLVTKKTGNEYTDIQLLMSDGAQVKLSVQDNGANGSYMNVNVVIPAIYWQRTSGLCGTYDDNPNNDFTKSDGTITGNGDEFGASWLLTDPDNVFAKGMDAAFLKNLKPQPVTKSCTLPAQAEFNAAGITPVAEGYETPVVQTTGYDAGPVVVATQNQDPSRGDQPFHDFVSNLCKEVVNVPGIEKVPQLPPNLVSANVNDCITDCKLGGTLDPVDPYRVAVQRGAHAVAVHAEEMFKICEATGKPRPRTADEIAKFAETIGFGSFACKPKGSTAADCSGNGTCDTFGCRCNPGWAGVLCTVDMNAKKAAIPPKPAVQVPFTG